MTAGKTIEIGQQNTKFAPPNAERAGLGGGQADPAEWEGGLVDLEGLCG